MKNSEKDFDAVEMMRDIKNKKHESYARNPHLREQRLRDIRKKYADKIKNRQKATD